MTNRTPPLAPRDAAELLRVMGAVISAELAALPTDLLRWHPAPGEWCVKEALGHLIEAERRGFAGRIRTMLAETEPRVAAWDQVAVARERRDCERDLKSLLTEFADLREPSIALVTTLGETDLARGGHHPLVGYLRIGDLIHEWVHHDRNHVRQMYANVQAYVWPHMGNAQRFSLPE